MYEPTMTMTLGLCTCGQPLPAAGPGWPQFLYINKPLEFLETFGDSCIAKVIEECGLQLPDHCPQPTVTAEDIAAEAAWAAAAARTLKPQGATWTWCS